MFNKYLFFSVLLLINQLVNNSNVNYIVFDLADLTDDVETENGFVHLEAFKTSDNNVIIENKMIENYGQLKWVSIGNPQLKLIIDRNDSTKSHLFEMKSQGFDIYIETLTFEHKKLFKDLVNETYSIQVKPRQIATLVPNKFDCKIIFISNGDQIQITGRAAQMNTSPIRVSFNAPEDTKKRISFENYLQKHGDSLNLDIVCDLSVDRKASKNKAFNLSSHHLNQMGIIDKIFGDREEIYVTQNQITELSKEVYQNMNIFEDFEISLDEFHEKFIEQTQMLFRNVDFNEGISKLSDYNIKAELEPDVISSEMIKVFSIVNGSMDEELKLNEEEFQKITNKYKETFGPFKRNISLFDEINEQNNQTENLIEWSRIGDIIISKSIKVAKIEKSKFNTNFNFPQAIQVSKETVFKRSFTFNTLSKQRKNLFFDKYEQVINKSISSIPVNIKNLISEEIEKVEKSCTKQSNDRIKQLEIKVLEEFQKINSSSFNKSEKVRNLFKNFLQERSASIKKIEMMTEYQNQSILGLQNQILNFNSKLSSISNHIPAYLCAFTISDPNSPIKSLTTLSNGYLASGLADNTIKIWNPKHRSLILTLSSGISDAKNVVVLPNGNLATGSDDNSIKIWNWSDGTLNSSLEGHDNPVIHLVVLLNGFLASVSYKRIIIWNPNNGSLIRTFSDENDSFKTLTVLQNGKLASVSGNSIKIWNWNDGTLNCSLRGHNFPIQSIVVLLNGYLASSSVDNIKIWNPNNGSLIRTFSPKNKRFKDITLLPNGYLAILFYESMIEIWNPANWIFVKSVDSGSSSINYLTSLPNGYLAFVSDENSIKTFDPNRTVTIRTFSSQISSVSNLIILPNGNLATNSDDNTIKIWNWNDGSLNNSFPREPLVLLPNGYLASASSDNIKIWNPNNGSLIKSLIKLKSNRYSRRDVSFKGLVVLPNGFLASYYDGFVIEIWNPFNGSLITEFSKYDRLGTIWIDALTALPNGFIAVSYESTIIIWNPDNGLIINTLLGHTHRAITLTVLLNKNLASGSFDRSIRIWNPYNGTLISTLLGHTDCVQTLIVLPNGYLASGSQDKKIKIWNPNDGILIRTLSGHTDTIMAFIVLPNGYLASGSHDETIKIWNLNNGELIRTLTGHNGSVVSFALLPSGYLVSSSYDRTIKIWI